MAANCLAERQPRHSYTWESFDGVYRNQIDYFLVQERWRSAVCNCRAYQGPDCDSDHSLVKLKFKLRLRRLQRRSATAQYEYANAGQFAVELRSSQLNSATGSLPWRYRKLRSWEIRFRRQTLAIIHVLRYRAETEPNKNRPRCPDNQTADGYR